MMRFECLLSVFALFASSSALPALSLPSSAIPAKSKGLSEATNSSALHKSSAWGKSAWIPPEFKKLDLAVKSSPTPIAYQRRGQYYLDNGNPELAIADFAKVIKLRPSGLVYGLRGQAYEYGARATNTQDVADAAVVDATSRKRAVLLKAAIADFNMAVKLNSRDVDSARHRVQCAWLLGDNTSADLYFNYFVSKFPLESGEMYVERGDKFVMTRQYHKAIEDYNKAIALKPCDIDGRLGRAAANRRLANHSAAIADLDFVLQVSPFCAKAHNQRGEERELIGEYKGAISDFLKAYQLDPVGCGTDGCTVVSIQNGPPLPEPVEYKYVDTKGNLLGTQSFEQPHPFSEGLAVFKRGNLFGFMDKSLRPVVAPQFSDAKSFASGLALVSYVNKSEQMLMLEPGYYKRGQVYVNTALQKGFINRTGKFVLLENPSVISDSEVEKGGVLPLPGVGVNFGFSEGLTALIIGTRYAYVDRLGKVVIPPLFEQVRPFKDGVALVKMGEKYGYIDKTGKFVLEPQFDLAGDFGDGLAPAIKLAGELLEADGSSAERPSASFLPRRILDPVELPTGSNPSGKNSSNLLESVRYGFIDKSGKFVLEPKYELPDFLLRGLAEAQEDLKPRTVLSALQSLPDELLSDKLGFHQGRAMICQDGLIGFIDQSGTLAVAPRYEAAGCFAEGLAPVKIKDKYGYINKTGDLVIEPKFDEARSFSDGAAIVGFKRTVVKEQEVSPTSNRSQ